MTQENEYARTGKSMADLKAVRQKLAQLRADASDIGMDLEIAGKSLTKPEQFCFEGQQIDEHFVPRYGDLKRYPKELFDASKLASLVDEIRTLMLEEIRLSKDLREMGYNPA
jgi:hypothetical protein